MRRLAVVLFALGLGVATASLLGPLVMDMIQFHVVDDVLNQVIGGDLVGLVLVAPVALAAGVLVWRGHRAGPILALAPARRALWANKLVYTVIGWGALLGSAVAGMGVVMMASSDPAASTVSAIAFVGFSGAFLALAVWLYRPLFASPDVTLLEESDPEVSRVHPTQATFSPRDTLEAPRSRQ